MLIHTARKEVSLIRIPFVLVMEPTCEVPLALPKYILSVQPLVPVLSLPFLQVRIIAPSAKWMGVSDIYIDDQYAGAVDMSRSGDELIGPCWTSPILPEGDHHLRLNNRAEGGEKSEGGGGVLAIVGLDILGCGMGSWQWDPRQGPRA